MTEEKSITFDVSVSENAPANITRLEQIIKNLVAKAIKFTDSGGVSVALSLCLPDTGIFQDELLSHKTLAVAVVDTGIGISPQQQSIISTRQHGDTGLGLSVSRELTHPPGGEIHLEM